MKNILMMVFCLFSAACNSQPSPLPPPAPAPAPPVVVVDGGQFDAGPEPVVDPGVRLACVNMAKIGCVEAAPVELCERVMQHALADNHTSVPLDCLTGAGSRPVARACGFVVCP